MGTASDYCEMRDGHGGWVTVGIKEALDRRKEDMRCPECLGRMRAHPEYNTGTRAHFEHRVGHPGCSLKERTFSGKKSTHPDPLD